MKKLAIIVIAEVVALIAVAAVLGVVGYRQGWFSRFGFGPKAGVASLSGGGQSGTGDSGAGDSGSSQGGGSASGQGSFPAAPQFDGNVAAQAWGGKVESITGIDTSKPDDVDWMSDVIDGKPDTNWHSMDPHGPTEIVLSFAQGDSVRIGEVKILAHASTVPRDVEVWVSTSGPTSGFTRVAAVKFPEDAGEENSIRFDPVEARYVKVRLIKNQKDEEDFQIHEIKVMEAPRLGYTPLLSRHPDLMGPSNMAAAGSAVLAAVAAPVCVPESSSTLTPGHGESKHVLVLTPEPWRDADKKYGGMYLKNNPEYRQKSPDFEVTAHMDFTLAASKRAQPQLLSDKLGYDTVVLEQVCQDTAPGPGFLRALEAWVAAGHKLIIEDADSCSPGPDYGWLPMHIKTDNPGAKGAEGDLLRFTEENWMAHARRGRPGFISLDSWENDAEGYKNELGDSNTLTEWDPHWCGQIVVRNVNKIFGFVAVYTHLGRGLIIYDGFDIDQMGTMGYDLMMARELAQGFDPDNLPCGARIGDFVVTTETRLLERPLQAGRSYEYPLTLISNQGYKGSLNLSVKANPGVSGMQASFAPASIALDGLAESKFTVSLPGNAGTNPQALEVKGVDTAGKTNSLCLQLVPPSSGELQVMSSLGRPARKNLEIILDASGSMKTALGKKTRWSTAHDVLKQVLATLPTDFNVGLRIYGHRESSKSPKTCTDSELVVPIAALDQQAILGAAEGVKPRGETPLVYSVLQSPADLKAVGGGTVIVITDGEESCHGDPVKAAAQLKASGLDITLNIVGFTTGQEVAKQLGGFAQATGGRFYAADNGETLARALQMAAVDRFPYSVQDASGKEVLTSEAGAPADELPPGEYTVVVDAGGIKLKAEHVRVALSQQTTLHIAQKNDQFVLE